MMSSITRASMPLLMAHSQKRLMVQPCCESPVSTARSRPYSTLFGPANPSLLVAKVSPSLWTVGPPLRRSSWSMRSSWTRVHVWNISTPHAAGSAADSSPPTAPQAHISTAGRSLFPDLDTYANTASSRSVGLNHSRNLGWRKYSFTFFRAREERPSRQQAYCPQWKLEIGNPRLERPTQNTSSTIARGPHAQNHTHAKPECQELPCQSLAKARPNGHSLTQSVRLRRGAKCRPAARLEGDRPKVILTRKP